VAVGCSIMDISGIWAHRFADKILYNVEEYEEILAGLKSIPTPVCEGFKRKPYDVKQGLLNSMIDYTFEKSGWETQPFIDTRPNRKSSQKGDFAKTTKDGLKIFVEVEFGNVASTFRDFYKFNLAYSLDTYDCGIFILPEKRLARRIDTIQNFDGAKKLVEEARNFINLPLIIIGVGAGKEINLLSIVNDINYWKTYKLDDFTQIIQEHKELLF